MTTSAQSTPENKQRGAYFFWGFLLGIGFSALVDNSTIVSVDSLFPEAFGITITVGVLGWLGNRRAKRDLEAQLMRRMRSSVRDVAVAAAEEPQHLGYFALDKDTFKGKNLERVQWSGVVLNGANLQGAALLDANLQGRSWMVSTCKEPSWTVSTARGGPGGSQPARRAPGGSQPARGGPGGYPIPRRHRPSRRDQMDIRHRLGVLHRPWSPQLLVLQ